MRVEINGLRSGSTLAVAVLLIVVFINIAGFSLILPLLPFYGREFGASPFEIALLFAAYSLGNVFGELYWGRLSDRIGRRRALITTTLCAALSYIAFAYATSLWLALLLRVVSGFFGGTFGVCQSYIADITAPPERARRMGLFGAAFNLGFVLGPAIGGLLARPEAGLAGFHEPILMTAVLCACAALWSVFALQDTRPAGTIRPLPDWSAALRFVRTHRLLLRLFLLGFIAVGAFASTEAVFGLWTAYRFGWSAREVGITFIAVGASGFAVQCFLIGPLSHRLGEARVIVTGLSVLGLSILLQPIIQRPLASVALMSTLMCGHSLVFPNVGALVSRTTPAEVQGSILGLLMSSSALARICLPPLLGLIYEHVGADAPYYVAALMIGAAVLVAVQTVRIRDAQVPLEGARA